jgi:hypothetical protein
MAPRIVTHCHCSMCRRTVGAGVVTWASFPSEVVRLTAGEGRLARYHSSSEATRSFCSVCGTSLFFESTRWPGQIDVTVASFDGPLETPPAMHIFHADRVPWIALGDDLPRCPGDSGS